MSIHIWLEVDDVFSPRRRLWTCDERDDMFFHETIFWKIAVKSISGKGFDVVFKRSRFVGPPGELGKQMSSTEISDNIAGRAT